MKHYTDIFFDFDDTLYDTQGNSVVALRKLYCEQHWERVMPPFEEFDRAYVETNMRVWKLYSHGEISRDTLIVERFRQPMVKMVEQRGGSIAWITPELCLKMSDRYGDIISREKGIVPGSRHLLEYLAAKGYRLHLCSNGFHEVQYRKLRSSGLEPFFRTVVLSEDAGANKPRRAFFDYAFRMTGAVPETTIMIGDNYDTDIAGAMGAGIDTILFNRWDIDAKQLPQQPTYIADLLSDIEHIL